MLVVCLSYSAAQLVLKAHKEAVNSLGGSSSAKLGTVATVVAAANATSAEASKQIEAAMKISMRAALGKLAAKPNEGQLDDLAIMKVHCLDVSRYSFLHESWFVFFFCYIPYNAILILEPICLLWCCSLGQQTIFLCRCKHL